MTTATTLFAQVDLGLMDPPDIVEIPDFDGIVVQMRTAAVAAWPDLADVIDLESDPVNKVIEICAYQAVLIYNRVNMAARAVMLPYATGADLDNLAALYDLPRNVVSPADEDTDAVMESDASFRARALLAPEGFSVAGPIGAYVSHALNASALVADVGVSSPDPGVVLVTILSTEGDGTPDAALLATVNAALNVDDVRPLCDTVIVAAPTILPYGIEAELEIGEGPDSAVVVAAANASVASYVARCHKLGGLVATSGLLAALHVANVLRATLIAPVADIEADETSAPWCTAVTVTEAA